VIGLYHYVALAMFAGFVLVEIVLAAGGRRFPSIAGWRLRGIAATLLYFALATYSPLLWDGWLGQHRLIAADQWPLWVQFVTGFLALEALVYAWHRTMHNVQPLWRLFHQMHHSSERIDIWSAFWFHPLDVLGFTLVGSLALVLGIGVSAEAAIAINIVATFMAMFQHANIATPRWIGYVIQRPESHSAHHERGVHARNYGDLPIFDMMFGTFHNPRTFDGECGFYDGGSNRLGAMLAGKEIA